MYKCNCNNCSTTYMGQTTRQVCGRLEEHSDYITTNITTAGSKALCSYCSNAKFQIENAESGSSNEEYECTSSDIKIKYAMSYNTN